MISLKDAQVYTPSLEEYEKYYSCINKKKSGYWSFLYSPGLEEKSKASTARSTGCTFKRGRLVADLKGGYTPTVKINRDSNFFKSSRTLDGIELGSEFSLQPTNPQTEKLNTNSSGLPVFYRVELIDDDAIYCRPTRPIAFGPLYASGTFGKGKRSDTAFCEKLATDFVEASNARIDAEGTAFQIASFEHTEKTIKFSKPVITKRGNRIRLACDVLIGGVQQDVLYYETTPDYEEYLCGERSDPFVLAAMPWAIRKGYDIICETPVTEALLHNINKILLPTLSKYDNKIVHIKVIAPSDNTLIEGKEVGAAMSLGVDSFYTLRNNLDAEQESFRPTQLLYTSSRGMPEESQLKHEAEERQEEAKEVAKEMGLPLVFVYSNSRMIFPLRHGYGHPYSNSAAVFALRKLFRMYYYSTAYDISRFTLVGTSKRATDTHLLFLVYVFTTPGLTFHISGANVSREEKLKEIADWDVVQKHLQVCLTSTKNCGESTKCKRTLLQLDYIGKLDEFYESFDIDHYKKNRVWYFKELLLESSQAFLGPIKDHFLEKEPELMKKAQRLVELDAIEAEKEGKEKRSKKERKRIRTLIKYDKLGKLDELRSSTGFDVDEYLENRANYFKEMILRQSTEFYAPLYKHFMEAEPALMKEAQRRCNRDAWKRRWNQKGVIMRKIRRKVTGEPTSKHS